MNISYLTSRVSVVIPCHNVAKFIQQSLESVFAQTLQPRQVICVDDGSTDGTQAILKHLQTIWPRLMVIEQTAQGACAARNTGLAHATGTWIQFLDGDDILLPYKLETQVKMALSEPDVNLVIGSYEEVDENLVFQCTRIECACPDPYVALMKSRAGRTSSLLFRREVVVRVRGWDTECKSSQEYDLMFRIMRLGGLAKFDERALTQLRYRAGSISNTNIQQNVTRMVKLRVRMYEVLIDDKYPFMRELQQAFFRSVRLAYHYDRTLAIQLVGTYFGATFRPDFNRLYAAIYALWGFERAEALVRLRHKQAPWPQLKT